MALTVPQEVIDIVGEVRKLQASVPASSSPCQRRVPSLLAAARGRVHAGDSAPVHLGGLVGGCQERDL